MKRYKIDCNYQQNVKRKPLSVCPLVTSLPDQTPPSCRLENSSWTLTKPFSGGVVPAGVCSGVSVCFLCTVPQRIKAQVIPTISLLCRHHAYRTCCARTVRAARVPYVLRVECVDRSIGSNAKIQQN
jgi:hypothetical protein